MARLNADLSFFMLVSDYDPVHYNWTKKELAALGDCKATAEVIKRRLEDNGTKVKEMYVIEHKGEKEANSKSAEHHNSTDEAKIHYHLLVRFEPTHGATLEDIAKYLGVPPQVIEKPYPGRYSYPNSLAYLTHIKYENKIQYTSEDVVTLAGTDYMDYFNVYKQRWQERRKIAAKEGRKSLDHLFQEATKKLESGELSCVELAGIPEYRKLFFCGKYHGKLVATEKRAKNLAYFDWQRLSTKLTNKEISKEEAKTCEEYSLAFKYYGHLLI